MRTLKSKHTCMRRGARVAISCMLFVCTLCLIVLRGHHTEHSQSSVVSSKPLQPKWTVAVVVCLTAKNTKQMPLAEMAVAQLLVPSFGRTVEVSTYEYVLYFGVDDDDPVWTLPQSVSFLSSIGTAAGAQRVVVKFFRNRKHHIPMNEILKVAYDDGCDYFVRVNDDTEFVTDGWTTPGIQALAAFDPPNVGVVGPTCHEGNAAILTHDMTHRTHLDIFDGVYYADEFDNWWLDDWISHVYGPTRTRKLASWTVKHHVEFHGTRYDVQHHKQKLLAREISRGKQKIRKWLQAPVKAIKYQKQSVMSTIYEIDVLHQRTPAKTINEIIHLHNVAFHNNTLHLYAVSESTKQALHSIDRLPAYKRFDDGKQKWDLPTPKIQIHNEPLIEPSVCTGGMRNETAFFYSPWHTDNMFHLHNDNILPLVDTIRHTPGCDPDTLQCDHTMVLYALAGDPRRQPVTAVDALAMVFDEQRSWTELWGDGGRHGTTCFAQVVWGRGPYFMYAGIQSWYTDSKYWVYHDGNPPLTRLSAEFKMAVQALRWRVFQHLGLVTVLRDDVDTQVVYLNRDHTGKRSISDIKPLMEACRASGVNCFECCDWRKDTFETTVRKISNATIVMGPHGAGLTHVLYARPSATLVQFGDGRPWHKEFSKMADGNHGGQFVGIDIGHEPWVHVPTDGIRVFLSVIADAKTITDGRQTVQTR